MAWIYQLSDNNWGWISKYDPNACYLQGNHFKHNDRLKAKHGERYATQTI